jgi:hypothetical protein
MVHPGLMVVYIDPQPNYAAAGRIGKVFCGIIRKRRIVGNGGFMVILARHRR